MECCMNSKEESGHKGIRPALMELSPESLVHSALCFKCILSRYCSLEKEKDEAGSISKPDPSFEELIDAIPACVSLVFPGADVRPEVKPRRGAGVASVTTGEEPPTGLWSGPGKPQEEERKSRAEQLQLGQLRGSLASLTSGGRTPWD